MELQLELKDKDALIEILEERATKRARQRERERDPDDLFSSSIPRPSGAWKKIVDHLIIEKAQMKTTYELEIRRI